MSKPVLWNAAAIAAAVNGKLTGDFAVTGVSIDSRSLEPGDLFVALQGPSFDGNDFVASALQRGAAGALIHRRAKDLPAKAPVIEVADTMRALEDLGRGSRARTGARIVAVTDWKGGVYNRSGLDISKLRDHAAQHKSVAGFTDGEPLTNEQIFTLDVDFLIPAALENQITKENAASIRAKAIVEGANGPTTPEAHHQLHKKGVFVVPDILANSGGVTGSYFEWVQNRHGYYWTEAEVNKQLEEKMVEAYNAVLKMSLKHKTDMRTAAYIVAIDRVATVTRLRGMYA